MLFSLIKIRLKALFNMIFRRRSAGKKASPAFKILIALLAVYVIGMMIFSMGMMMYAVAEPLIGAGLDWLYFAIAGMMATVLGIFGSIFTVQKELFDATDNELLLSMPIPSAYIIASRLALIITLELIYTIIIMLPAGIVYGLFAKITAQGIISLIIGSALLTLLMMAVATLAAWLVGLITSRMRMKTLLSTLLMLGFLGLYFWLVSNLNKYIAQLALQGESIAVSFKKALPPLYDLGLAVTSGGLTGLAHLGLLAAWCVLPFAVVYIIISRSFIKLATTAKSTVKVEYKRRALKVSSGLSALFGKELQRFFSLPAYMLNCGLGALLLFVLAVAVIVKRGDIIAAAVSLPGGGRLLAPVMCAAMCFCVLMTNSAAPSLSLEGKALWILKAHPINPMDVYKAKINVNIILGLPGIIAASIACWFVLPIDTAEKALLLILPLVFLGFTAVYGMALNILFPRFEWVNETLVIKQSASTLLAVLGGMAIAALPVIVSFAALKVMTPAAYLAIVAAIFAVAAAALYRWIATRGVKRFAEM